MNVPGVFDIAGDAGNDAVDRPAHRVANRRDAGSRIFQIGPQMREAHEAKADHGDVHFLFHGILRRGIWHKWMAVQAS